MYRQNASRKAALIMKTWADFNIMLPPGSGIELTTTCPQCSGKRKNSKAKCLSINTEKGVWVCHHCDFRGTLKAGEESPGRKIYVRPVWTETPDRDVIVEWFRQRGILPATLVQEGVSQQEAYMPQLEDTVPCIAFPYRKRGEIVNVKYRALQQKAFRQVAGAEKVLYRQDHIAKEYVAIVEGEIDALSLVQAGIDSVVSVPDGAPPVNTKNYTAKFTYLDQDPDPFEGAEKIVLAVDNDAPGTVLRDELGRRLGMDRCWFVDWPKDCKDANDVLIRYGAEFLRLCIEQARPFPVVDVITVADLADEIMALAASGLPRGLSTGWAQLDEVFTIVPGQLTIITGIPSHGKSQFVDALAINMMQLHGWQFAICSPENYPTALHGVNLMEKWTNATVRSAPITEARMLHAHEIPAALAAMNASFVFIAPPDAMTIPAVLERATSLVKRRGVQGLILDPFNEFDHQRERGQTEAEYISNTLGEIRRWGRRWGVHVFLVAHPVKMQKDDQGNYPVPTPYDINGGAAWRNKSENCLTVWRDMNVTDGIVQIHTQKIRHRNLGVMPAMVELRFNRWTSRYE